ncbi:MAG: penicillin acylase family protein [Pseudomonadales bacterium]|jgi:penicillin amidase|nr:penicillin acylase family protein [Pseudomonadales bacterium]MDP6471996.1 penicillin acylase family protein [Pseudomonadales bacterium]MDP6826733.1 penicillin acylase family protein [Pseudomonadales bacterium]MDP6972667.1 penicillin acylase family protein [Pseudomonadales bacterium]
MTSPNRSLVPAFTLAVILMASAMAQADTIRYTVKGLLSPAEILVDEWGVPHIYAGTHYDAFFVQGFNAARDRLWQIDLWRRRGLGLLSEVLGEPYLKQDRASRTFLFRGDMYREWLSYGSDAKAIAKAFAAGINAFVDLTSAHPELLPPEFRLLDYAPSRWTAADIVRIRSNGLWRNITSEVQRAVLACRDGLQTAALAHRLEPDWTTSIPEGLDPCVVPEDVLDLYVLAKAPVTFGAAEDALAEAAIRESDRSIGSNNWVVAPSRTQTGRPILADDPHRAHAVPSLRYIAHLIAPGLDVIGAGEPALPGISIGHNQDIAFGLTIFPIDQEDLYVYTKKRSGYTYQGRTESFREIEEQIPVGADSVPVTLKFTRHGPVIHETRQHAFAVRASWLTPGMSPYFGSIEYMRADNWREFLAALNRWGAPAENQVFADTDGNIGYKPAGLFPKRRNWDGLLPVPGDGRYEWDGFHDMDVLPVEYNPERGYTGTANSMNLPGDYPIETYRIGFEWSAPWRYKRLWEVLAGQNEHSIQDSLDLQRDYVSILARRVVHHLPQGNFTGSDLLRGWNAELTADSAAAALYVIWYHRHLVPGLIDWLAPDSQLSGLDTRVVLDALARPEAAGVIRATLTTAWDEAIELLGADASTWRWGGLHQIRFEHPLLAMANPDLASQMRYPAYERGGSANTTNNTGFYPDDFKVRAGASYRIVLDVGNWDAARVTNAPGQSGDPRSPFYDNLLESWATEGSFPLLYSREAIEKHTRVRIELQPAP